MKRKFLRVVLFAALFASIIINMPFKDKNNTKIFTLPGLPRPIAKTPIAIISAGQSTDSYIIHDISNQLMLRSFFMPQARDTDLKEVNTIVFVIVSMATKTDEKAVSETIDYFDKIFKKQNNSQHKVIMILIAIVFVQMLITPYLPNPILFGWMPGQVFNQVLLAFEVSFIGYFLAKNRFKATEGINLEELYNKSK